MLCVLLVKNIGCDDTEDARRPVAPKQCVPAFSGTEQSVWDRETKKESITHHLRRTIRVQLF